MLTAFTVVSWLGSMNNAVATAFAVGEISFTLLLSMVYGLGLFLVRKHVINGDSFTSTEYALIKDELRNRGINNARRFMREHPEHVRCAKNMSRGLDMCGVNYHATVWQTAWRIEALIFSVDTDPENTKSILMDIANNRGVIDQDDVRELLHTLLRTATPLGSGAL